MKYEVRVELDAVFDIEVEAGNEEEAGNAAVEILREKVWPHGSGFTVLEEMESGVRDPDIWMSNSVIGVLDTEELNENEEE